MKNILKFSLLALLIGVLFVSCKNNKSGETAATGAATGTAAEIPGSATTYSIDPAKSKVLWVGTKPTGSHNGTIVISEGMVAVADGNLVGGKFSMDMNTITDLSQKPGEGKEDLEAHLKGTVDAKSDDFFDVRKYPTSTFVITKVTPITGDGEMTHNITGDLTIKGTTKSITFPASVAILEGKVAAVTPSFKIDRTDFGVNFKSKSVFSDLKDKFIDDEIALNIQLETK